MKSNDGTTQAQTPRGVFHIQSEKDWALAMEVLADADPGTYRLVLQSPFHSLRDISEFLSRLPGSILIDLDMSAATGVTSIEAWAFEGCKSLSSVSIPAGVTSIGESAFEDCSALKEITIPASVTSIGERAFAGCSSLSSVSIPAGVTSIGGSAFADCTALSSVSIPAGVTSIGLSAFEGCTALSSVSIPASVTSIEQSAFKGCTALSSVSIPAGVTSIGERAFAGCSALSSVSIPAGVTSIGGRAFEGCSSLERFMVEERNAHFSTDQTGRMLLSKDGTTLLSWPSASGDISIPAGVTSIGWRAFAGCSSLSSVSIPASVTSIGREAFKGCSSLERFMVEERNEHFSTDQTGRMLLSKDGTTLLSWPSASGDISIPAGVTSIGGSAFAGCTALSSVSIPASVTSIGWKAFEGCSSLERFMVEERNEHFSTDQTGRMLLSKDGTALLSWPSASGDISIPAGVISIEEIYQGYWI